MEYRQLAYFVRVAELGSFSRASIDLNIAQPALSRQVRKLEEEFSVELLFRNGRGVSLTHEGEIMLRLGRSILRQVQDVSAELTAAREHLAGPTSIGLPPSIGRTLSIPLARTFRENHPDVRLRIVEGLSGNVLEWLYSGRIDVGVLYLDPHLKVIVAEPLVDEELVLIGPRDAEPPLENGSIPLREISNLPLILPSDAHGLTICIQNAAASQGLALNVVLEVDSLFSIIETVRQRMGYTILSRASVERDLEDGTVNAWPIVGRAFARTLYVATASQRSKAISVRRIAHIVRQEILKLEKKGLWAVHSTADTA